MLMSKESTGKIYPGPLDIKGMGAFFGADVSKKRDLLFAYNP